MPPLGVLVAVGDLQDELVVAGVEVAAHGQRDLLAADLAGRDVEAVLEVVDEPVVLDDLADDVDVVEALLAERARLQLRLRDEQREVHADLVGAQLREADELRDAEVGRVRRAGPSSSRGSGPRPRSRPSGAGRACSAPRRREGARAQDGRGVLDRLLDRAPLEAARDVDGTRRPCHAVERADAHEQDAARRRSAATSCRGPCRTAGRRSGRPCSSGPRSARSTRSAAARRCPGSRSATTASGGPWRTNILARSLCRSRNCSIACWTRRV